VRRPGPGDENATMKCEVCQKQQAVVHLTDVSNNQKREMHLCEDCAKEKGVTIKSHMNKDPNFPEFLTQLVESQTEATTDEKDIRCPRCGITYRKFRSTGKFGCPNDYNVFRKGLLNLLEKIHQKVQHVGKIPSRVSDNLARQKELNQLREELSRAVETEAYEKAAEIRDRIYSLEKGGK
jgi:protein arginine kinase activator